jgi:hypothetical protein
MIRGIIFAILFSIVIAQNIIVTLPVNALSAVGLATPWTNTENQSIACNAGFAQGNIYDPNVNNVFAYNPLIITAGTKPAVVPAVPTFSAQAVVGVWFGTNGNTLTLADNNNGADLAAANCVNGITGSIFGQFAYCNAVNYFNGVNNAINAGTIKVPPLGTANDGMACPTSRDFFVVDMDQSDNVVTTYLVTTTQLVAQGTVTNMNNLGNNVVAVLANGSDERLVSVAMDGALACTPWKVQDLGDTAVVTMVPTFGTNELQAAVWQQAPIAITPISHAMTRVNNQPSLPKTNAYRAGCDQAPAGNVQAADGFIYCQNLYYTGPRRLALNAAPFSNFGSPMACVATNLFAFLGQRFATSFGPDGLNCASLLNVPPPVVPIKNMGGVFVGATITVPVPPGTTTGLSTNTIIIIVVCTVVGGLLIIGLIIGVIWYRNRSMYS